MWELTGKKRQLRIPTNERGVNRSARRKFSAPEHKTIKFTESLVFAQNSARSIIWGGDIFMKYKVIIFFLALLFIFINNSFAYVIIVVEKGSITYRADTNGSFEDEANYKIYYDVDEVNKVIKRVKLVALRDIPQTCKKGEVISDNTVYKIIEPSQLSILKGERVIHGVGQPGINATELLTISKDSVMSSKSTGDYVVVYNCKIIERSDILEK
jgi:hypothetical protein